MMDVIAEIKSINLKKHIQRRGVRFNGKMGFCPFHEDKNPSLSIHQKADVWLWKCFSDKHDPSLSGGTIIDWEKNYGIGEAEAIDKIKKEYNIQDETKPRKKIIEAEYIYHDKDGKESYRKIRYKGKDFAIKPAGKKQILYRLPELLKNKETCWFVEGEKDVESLRTLKIPATTAGGVNSWKKEHAPYFKDKKVIVCMDAGTQEHMKKIAADLVGVAKEVRIADLEKYGLNKDEDITDYIGNSITEDKKQLRKAVLRLAEEAPVYKKQKKEEDLILDTEEPHLTDMGNAQRFAALHQKNTKFCHPWGKWLNFCGTHWKKDDSGDVERKARDVIKQMYKETSKLKSEAARKELAQFAIKCESNHKIRSMLSLAQSEPGIPILPKDLDSDPWLLNVKNGTIDLKTGKLKPHKKEDFITKLAPVEFDPEAECPQFRKFLIEIMKNNDEIIEFLKKALGYGLTGSVQEHAFFILHGRGANGKTTLLNLIFYILGDYAQRTPVETLLLRRTTGVPNDVARLKGARFVSAMEVEQNRRLAESLVKALTGGDVLTARFLFGEFFEFDPQFKLFLGTNHKPVIRGTDHAMWRRIKLIPFEVVIPDEKQDKNLFEKLEAEASGILNWLLEGCLMWQEEGLGAPEEVKQATLEYQTESDVIGQFFNDCVAEDKESKLKSSELYIYYKGWCEDNGEKALSQTALGRTLIERGHKRKKYRDGVHYLGLKLKEGT